MANHFQKISFVQQSPYAHPDLVLRKSLLCVFLGVDTYQGERRASGTCLLAKHVFRDQKEGNGLFSR